MLSWESKSKLSGDIPEDQLSSGGNKLEFYFLIISSIVILPFLYLKKTIDPVITIRLLFLTVILLGINFILLIKLKKYLAVNSILRRKIFLFFGIYLLFSSLSLINAINIPEGLFSLGKILVSFILFVNAVLILNKNRAACSILSKIISICALLVSLIGITQHFFDFFNFVPGVDVVYSLFVNRNLFSSVLFLALPFLIYSYFSFSKFWLIINFITISFSFFLITIIKARAVWLGILTSFIFVILLVVFFKYKKKKYCQKIWISKRGILLGLAIIVITVTAYIFFSADISSHRGQKEITSRDGLNVRLKAWQKTIPMVQEHPLLGVGVGNWKIVLPKYGVKGMRTEKGAYQYIRPHNDFVWVLAEIGIIGFIAYLTIFLLLIYYLLRIISKTKSSGDRLFSILLLFGLIGYMVVSSFSFPRERIFHLVLFIFLISTITVIYERNFPNRRPVKKSITISISLVSLMLLLPIMFFNYQRLKSEVHLYFALNAGKADKLKLEIAALSKIDQRIYNMTPMGIPVLWHRGIAHYDLKQNKSAYKDFYKAYQSHPYHIYILNNLASSNEILGKHADAIKYYEEVLRISPDFEESILNLSAVYYNKGDYKKASEVIERCNPHTANPKYHLYKKKIKEKFNNFN